MHDLSKNMSVVRLQSHPSYFHSGPASVRHFDSFVGLLGSDDKALKLGRLLITLMLSLSTYLLDDDDMAPK